MTGGDRVRALVAGLAAGVAGGLFGVGGGLVLIPMLTGFFGLSQHQAHGTSLAVIGATALASLVVYGAFSNVAWLTALLVAAASTVTVRYGARWANRISSRGLARAFAVFLVLVAARLLWRTPVVAAAPLYHGVPAYGMDLLLGGAVGVLAGFMGVGGGILAVPAFTLVLGMAQQTAQGTSLAVILATAPAGAYEHARHGNVVWPHVPVLALGGAAGGLLASRLAQDLPHALLARGFALFLLVNAVHTWTRAGRQVRGASIQQA